MRNKLENSNSVENDLIEKRFEFEKRIIYLIKQRIYLNKQRFEFEEHINRSNKIIKDYKRNEKIFKVVTTILMISSILGIIIKFFYG